MNASNGFYEPVETFQKSSINLKNDSCVHINFLRHMWSTFGAQIEQPIETDGVHVKNSMATSTYVCIDVIPFALVLYTWTHSGRFYRKTSDENSIEIVCNELFFCVIVMRLFNAIENKIEWKNERNSHKQRYQ